MESGLPGPAMALVMKAEAAPAGSGHWLFCQAFLKRAEL